MERARPEYETLQVLTFFRALPHLILNLAFIPLLRRKRFRKIKLFGRKLNYLQLSMLSELSD
jgi:hypothetical protein